MVGIGLTRRALERNAGERILTLPPAHDRTSLSSFGGEGWGEEAALSESHCRPGLQTRRCPPPQPSPRAPPAGGGRKFWWQGPDALSRSHPTPHAPGEFAAARPRN